MKAYIYGGISVFIIVILATAYVFYLKWDKAQAEALLYQQQFKQAEQAIKEQQDVIEDLNLQARIVAREMKELQQHINRIEEENDQSNRELDDLVNSLPDKETEEAQKALNEGLFKTLEKLEKSSRR